MVLPIDFMVVEYRLDFGVAVKGRSRSSMRTIIGFHNPDEVYGFLSNWYLSDFSIDGISYSSMEQYMMHQKALLFKDSEAAEEILKTEQVGKIKALGRSV